MKEVSDVDEFKQLIKNTEVVFLDVYATWCGPCKKVAPVFEALSTEFSRRGKVAFVKTNCADSQDVAQVLNVASVPTFVAFVSGEEVGRLSGGNPDKLRQFVLKFLPDDDDEPHIEKMANRYKGMF